MLGLVGSRSVVPFMTCGLRAQRKKVPRAILRPCLDFYLFIYLFLSLITSHSIFVTHHSSLKIPQLSTPHPFGHYFQISSLNFFYFLWDPYLSNWLETTVSLPASPSFSPIFVPAHFILPPPQS